MKKMLFVSIITITSFYNVYAGGLLTNTNQNIAILRNPARAASIEIDAAYSNPAGLAFLSRNGLFISLNNTSVFQTRTISADFAPFEGFGQSNVKTFKGEATSWVVPNLQVAYKTGNWVISTNIGNAGGGGLIDFSNGLPSFESTVAIVPALLKEKQPTLGFGEYDLKSYWDEYSIMYGMQLGLTYMITGNMAAYAGFRYNFVDNFFESKIWNIRLKMNGNFVPASAILANPDFTYFTPFLSEKELDCKLKGSGIAPVLGLDYKYNKLNIGVKYEFKTGVELKNITKVNSAGVDDYNDGAVTPYDLPALLTIGIQYDIIRPLTFSAAYHHFFDSNAKMAHDKQKFITGGINEYLAGVEYRINDLFLTLSCGVQLARTGVSDNYQTDVSYSLNATSMGFGGAVDLTKNLRLNVAYFFTNYRDMTKKSDDYGKIHSLSQGAIPKTAGSDTFGRTGKSYGIGFDFRF